LIQAVQRKRIGFNWNDYMLTDPKSAGGENSGTWRAINYDQLPIALGPCKASGQEFRAEYSAKPLRSLSKCWTGGNKINPSYCRWKHRGRNASFQGAQESRAFVSDPEMQTGAALRVNIHDQYPLTRFSQDRRNVHCRGGFTDPAFMVGERNDRLHALYS
jgi:hypothetical protein